MFKDYAQCQITILPVRNFKESLEFYKNVLGFDVAWIWDDEGYGAVHCGGVEIHLDKQDVIHPYQSYLFVNDVDVIYAWYRDQGVRIVKEIESKPWNVREFTFEDINGHLFRVASNEENDTRTK
ncbi:VOC family protein [Paenibacillus sp. PR3]|uniref:VOC family protein n=1 Tax=Paenibacillus terricola TaxID=2763503 RepID=A0ABR8N460_9BACL|nr:VOC family protein [Paenibacillus terricola]MBD3922959.1 VOC family protein [Paenibacillus terricola]